MLKTFFSRLMPLITLLIVFASAVSPRNGLPEDLLKYTNEYRRSKGLSNLEMRTDLNSIARNHSEEMASGKTGFGHNGYDKRVRKIKEIFKTCTVAENVAYGANNAKEAFTIWRNSSGHRKNMLGGYKYIGIGTAKNNRGVIYYTEIFVK